MRLRERMARLQLDRNVSGKVLIPFVEHRAHTETPSQRKKRKRREGKARARAA